MIKNKKQKQKQNESESLPGAQLESVSNKTNDEKCVEIEAIIRRRTSLSHVVFFFAVGRPFFFFFFFSEMGENHSTLRPKKTTTKNTNHPHHTPTVFKHFERSYIMGTFCPPKSAERTVPA